MRESPAGAAGLERIGQATCSSPIRCGARVCRSDCAEDRTRSSAPCGADTRRKCPPGGLPLPGRPARSVRSRSRSRRWPVRPGRDAHAGNANWDWSCSLTLLAFSVVSDLVAVDTRPSVKISGSFLALVLAMVFLGGPPAALIGVGDDHRRLAALARHLARLPEQPRHLRMVPAARRPSVHAVARRGRPRPRRRLLLPARIRRLRVRAG